MNPATIGIILSRRITLYKIQLAQEEFDVFVTMDKNLEHQQNLKILNLGVIVLQTYSNAYPAVAPLMPKVNEPSRAIQPGEVVHIKG